jgi:nucleoside-diphosphate-sugar epimerase
VLIHKNGSSRVASLLAPRVRGVSAPLHVVLGTGPVGLAVVRELRARGERVRLVARTVRDVDGVEAFSADASRSDEAIRACAGAAVVYHCANLPYHRWPELHPPLMAAVIDGAAAARAKLVFADNLYAYGPVGGPLREDLPDAATGPNGRTRAVIAGMLRDGHRDGRVRATIGRASDFFGPYARQSIVGDEVFARALVGQPARVLGDPDLAHSVTFIDDFAVPS